MVVLLAVPIASAANYTTDTFNDSSAAKNVTFAGNENQTVYVNIPLNANITSASLALAGYSYGSSSKRIPYDYILNNNYDNCGDPSSTPTYMVDGVLYTLDEADDNGNDESCGYWSITASGTYTQDATYEYYYTPLNEPEINLTSRFKLTTCSGAGSCFMRFTMKIYNWTDTSWDGLWTNQTDADGVTDTYLTYTSISDSESYYPDGILYLQMEATGYSVGAGDYSQIDYYDTNISYTGNIHPHEAYLESGTADGNREWNNTGVFNTTKTGIGLNITALQAYVDSCTPDTNGNCSVPLLLHSNSSGIIEVSAVQINYTDALVWANTTPASRSVSMPLDYTDTFTVNITNKGYWAKAFTIGCEGCGDYFNISTTLSDDKTSSLGYLGSNEFSLTVDPADEEVTAGTTYKFNITVNGSGEINHIAMTYVIGSAAGGGGGGGGGGSYVEVIPACPEGMEVFQDPITKEYECVQSDTPILEAEAFLLDYPVVFGISIFNCILIIISAWFAWSFRRTGKPLYLLGIAFMFMIFIATSSHLPLYSSLNNILNTTAGHAASVIP